MGSPRNQLELFSAPASEDAVPPAPADPELTADGARLSRLIHLGTSTWSFPGWEGIVYGGSFSERELARVGLRAYARHPLLRAVGIDRTYWAPVPAPQLAGFAAQVPEDFRFIVKAHEHCVIPHFSEHARHGSRRGSSNPRFLDASYALESSLGPALEGLGPKLACLVFQFPPLRLTELGGPAAFADRLQGFLSSLPKGAPVGVELRNKDLVTPLVGQALASVGAVPVFSRWGHLPSLHKQFELLGGRQAKALVIRWMLREGLEYEEGLERYAPFNQLVDEDPTTRAEVAELCQSAADLNVPCYVTVNNKAEGSSPLSIRKLARAILARSG